jgi:hypothetical protein
MRIAQTGVAKRVSTNSKKPYVWQLRERVQFSAVMVICECQHEHGLAFVG